MNGYELVAVGLFLVAAWGHGCLLGITLGSWSERGGVGPRAVVAETPDEDPRENREVDA